MQTSGDSSTKHVSWSLGRRSAPRSGPELSPRELSLEAGELTPHPQGQEPGGGERFGAEIDALYAAA